jgi:anion-transporting  ArsA/GET3 family ATPase
MAAATALLAARSGKRVLLVEVDAKGDVPAQFEQKAVGFTPREVYPGVLAMAMDTEASLREYLRVSMRVPIIGKLGPLARVLDFVAEAAPGVKEILTIGKIMWEVRESIEGRADHDIVIVDAAASGHVVAQLGAADAIQELVDVGPLRDQTRWLSELIADPHVTAVNIVTTPEEMPVTETIELVARLRAEVDVPLGAVIVNRVLPELFTHSDEETFEALREPEASALLTERAGRGAVQVLDAARLAVSLRRTRAAHLEELRATVELPMIYVPYLFVRDHGLRVTRMVADALGAELGQ